MSRHRLPGDVSPPSSSSHSFPPCAAPPKVLPCRWMANELISGFLSRQACAELIGDVLGLDDVFRSRVGCSYLQLGLVERLDNLEDLPLWHQSLLVCCGFQQRCRRSRGGIRVNRCRTCSSMLTFLPGRPQLRITAKGVGPCASCRYLNMMRHVRSGMGLGPGCARAGMVIQMPYLLLLLLLRRCSASMQP